MADHLSPADSSLCADTAPDPDAPHLCLWNTEAFYGLRGPEVAHLRRQYDRHDDRGRLVGSLVGGVEAGEFTSGFGAPFGGFDVARADEAVDAVVALVDGALESLAADGCHDLSVRAQPPHYGQNVGVLEFVLLNRGFSVAACDVNAFLDLRALRSVDDYVAALKPAARKMLRRSAAQPLTAFQVDPGDETTWADCYEVLRRNRVDRGRPMHLSLDYVRAIRDAFPGRVRLLAVAEGGAVCAAALVYRVVTGRDLVQYWGDAGHSLDVSPMNLLVRTVVEHALASGSRTVDIGISSEDGVPNLGLVQFKRSVGCRLEPRTVYRRSGP